MTKSEYTIQAKTDPNNENSMIRSNYSDKMSFYLNSKELETMYTTKFTKQFRKIVNSFQRKVAINQIYKDLGMSKAAFYNYAKDRLPKYTSTLILIKNYFEVPFSYLFGEIDDIKVDSSNVKIKYRLSDKSLEVLESLSNEAKSGSELAEEKLHAINLLITDDKMITLIATLFEANTKSSKDEDIELLKCKVFLEFLNLINKEEVKSKKTKNANKVENKQRELCNV